MSDTFGTSMCNATFPAWDDPEKRSRMWITVRSQWEGLSFTDDPQIIAHVSMRGEIADTLTNSAGLTRSQVADAIEVLQRALDEAGPEPIVEPEGIAYAIDPRGFKWHRKGNGKYNGTADRPGHAYPGYRTFDSIVREQGSLRPVRIVEKSVTEVVEEHVELDLVTA